MNHSTMMTVAQSRAIEPIRESNDLEGRGRGVKFSDLIALGVSLAELQGNFVEEGDCLIWRGSKTGQGHPYFRRGGRFCNARRAAYMLSKRREVRAGCVVYPRCRNSACIAEGCLAMGTQQQACITAARAGAYRTPACVASRRINGRRRAKLDAEKARAIMASKGVESSRVLAERLGVSVNAISLVWRGKTWRSAFVGEQVAQASVFAWAGSLGGAA